MIAVRSLKKDGMATVPRTRRDRRSAGSQQRSDRSPVPPPRPCPPIATSAGTGQVRHGAALVELRQGAQGSICRGTRPAGRCASTNPSRPHPRPFANTPSKYRGLQEVHPVRAQGGNGGGNVLPPGRRGGSPPLGCSAGVAPPVSTKPPTAASKRAAASTTTAPPKDQPFKIGAGQVQVLAQGRQVGRRGPSMETSAKSLVGLPAAAVVVDDDAMPSIHQPRHRIVPDSAAHAPSRGTAPPGVCSRSPRNSVRSGFADLPQLPSAPWFLLVSDSIRTGF